ncbi:SpoIIE family protein phosphatase [Bacillus sp. AK128]
MIFKHMEILEELIEHAPDLIMILNTKGEYVYVNNTLVQTFGRPKEAYLGNHFTKVNRLTPDSLDYCINIFPEIIDGKTRVIKIRALNIYEKEITLSVNCKMIHSNGQSFLYLILRDSTEEYIWEIEKGELLEYNDLLGFTMNQIGVGILITDPKLDDNPIIYVNEGFKLMTGYSEDEVIGRNCRILQGPKSNQETVSRMRKGINQKTLVHEELVNYRKDQSTFWNELTISPVFSKNGEVEYFIGVQQDVTARKTLELDLQYDLKLAKNLQQVLLSKPLKEKEIHLIGYYRPSQELGGDFYKYEQIQDGLYIVFIIDVMGHGITSSLLTMSIHTEISSILNRKIHKPDEILKLLNKHILQMFSDEANPDLLKYYFTCVCLLINTKDKKIEFVNAGHPDFILVKNGKPAFYSSTTIPVGLLEDASFKVDEIDYEPGTEILLYTDGLLEHSHLQKEDVGFKLISGNLGELFDDLQDQMPEDDICIIHIDLK